jgi:hypothetical protein
MENPVSKTKSGVDRRSFIKTGLVAGGAATIGSGLLGAAPTASAQRSRINGRLTPGDAAILRFLAAAELIETDLWIQYAELGGLTSGQPIEVDPNQLSMPTRTRYRTSMGTDRNT